MFSLAKIRPRLGQVKLWAKNSADDFLGDLLVPALYRRIRPPRGRRVPEAARISSVLVWNVDSLGDSLWITPALRALREGLPSARISVACNREVREIFEGSPRVDEIIPIDASRFYRGTGLFKRVRELEGRYFNLVIILEMGSRPADRARILSRHLGADFVMSSDLGHLKWLSDVTLPRNEDTYWPEYFLGVTKALKIPAVEPKLEVHATAEDEARAEKLWRELKLESSENPVVVLHPGVATYAGLTKKWPAISFVELARILKSRLGAVVLVTGSSSETRECEGLVEQMRAISPGIVAHSVAGRLSARETVCFLAKVSCVVTADTALLHLSLASAAPTIALFGATDARKIAPHDGSCEIMDAQLPCSPCHANRDAPPFWPECIYDSPKCMQSISPGSVAERVEKVLRG